MKSREPVLVHGRDYWDEVNLPASEFRNRIEAIRERMDREGVDALLVYGRGDRDGHLCYVSNLVNKVPNWGLLVSITQDHVLVRNERSSRTRPVTERGTWIEDIQFCDSVVEDIAEVVGEPGTTVGTAGFDQLPYRQRTRFEKGVAEYDVVAVDDHLAELRRAKSERERDQVARAARILTDVHESFPSEDNVEERKLANGADRRARLRGAQDFRFLVSNPTATEADLRPAEDIQVGASDPLVLYTAVRFEGYWAECARTCRLDGETPDGVYDDAVAAYTTFLDAIRAGRTAAEVVEEARTAVADLDCDLAPASDLGHGIGLEVEEAPRLEETEKETELAAGTTVSARLTLETDSDSLVVLNDTLEVRDGRPVILTGDWW